MITTRVTAIGLCLLAGACSMFVDKNTHDFPPGSKDAFMSSCMSRSGGKQEACSCLLGKVQEKYTYGEVDELEQKLKKGEQSPEFTEFMTKATEACLSSTGSGRPTSVQR